MTHDEGRSDIPEQGNKPMTQIYVCGFLLDLNDQLLLVEKLKPDWQAGRLNGIGGKVEFGEEPVLAMIREWSEEVGSPHTSWEEFCRIEGANFGVHFYKGKTEMPHWARLKERDTNDVGEKLVTVGKSLVPQMRTIPNLKWLVPLAFDDIYEPVAHVVNRR